MAVVLLLKLYWLRIDTPSGLQKTYNDNKALSFPFLTNRHIEANESSDLYMKAQNVSLRTRTDSI